MPSLGIAPRPEGCVGCASSPSQGEAPVSGVFPADGKLHLLEIGFQAIQLSPYHAGLPAHCSIRLDAVAGFLACSCPLNLSAPGKPSDPGTSLRVPPSCTGNTARRLVAHKSSSTVQRSPAARTSRVR